MKLHFFSNFRALWTIWVYGMGTCIIHGYQQQGFPKTLDRAGAMVGLEEVYIYFLIITKIIDLYQSSGQSPFSWSPIRSQSLGKMWSPIRSWSLSAKKVIRSDHDLRSFFRSFCRSFSNFSQPLIWIIFSHLSSTL